MREKRGSGDYCRWGALGSTTFPLIKGNYDVGDPQLVNVLENHQGIHLVIHLENHHSRETLVSQGEFHISSSGPREGYNSTM